MYTAYKNKANKVRPVDSDKSLGDIPRGYNDWKERAILRERARGKDKPTGKYDRWLTLKFSDIQRGSRLIAERIEGIIISPDLSLEEKDLLLKILYNREAIMAWNMSEIGHVVPDIAPL